MNEVDTAGQDSCLYRGRVYHRRMRPREHALKYRVFSMYVDIDRLQELASKHWCFSYNGFNLFSFYDKDYGRPGLKGLRSGVETLLTDAGIDTKPAKIMLLSYPRMLGYAFNPLSVYYCYDEGGTGFAMLYEVHNTFRERHTYVLRSEFLPRPERSAHSAKVNSTEKYQRQALNWSTHSCDKLLHVSPFAPMDMHYRFRLNQPAEHLELAIQVSDSEGLMLTAGFHGAKVDFSTRSLLSCFFYYPLMTAKVVAGIHWEALLLWLKRVPWFSHSRVEVE